MTDRTATAETARFETAGITALRHALLADADVHENRAAAYSGASTGTEMAAWCGLLLAASHNRMAAALLGLLDDPRVPADLAERGRSLVGQVLAGWPEVLEGANDDLPAAPVPQIEGQTVIALVPGRQDTAAETRTCTGCDGTGERRDFNTDGEFESVERCGGCDGTGRVAIEDAAESGAER